MTDLELQDVERLVEAFLAPNTADAMRSFIKDLMTEAESKRFARRLYAAYQLSSGASYTFLEETTDLSSATISHISKQLKNPQGGYNQILSRLYPSRFGDLDGTDPQLEELKSFLATTNLE